MSWLDRKYLNIPNLFWVFLLGLLVINGLQSWLTELDPDEAYYWMYSRQLDWGYFDHPPMIALLIKAGYAVFQNELGVRFMTIICQLISFYGIWLLANQPNERHSLWLLILLMTAMPMFQVYGFIATPDGPLLLFSTWFLVAYSWFLKESNWSNTFLLGALMAALLYSKYHGVLLIFFVLFSNLSLLKNPRFYLASIFGFLLFFPHLFWQYQHDFPSFRYHLKGRDDVYELKHTFNYLLNQLLIFSPLLFPFIVMSLRRIDGKLMLNRAFLFIIGGFWLFFLWSTFKGHTEPQWTAILSIPFVLILFQYAKVEKKQGVWIRRMALISTFLLILARIGLVVDFSGGKSSFHDTKWISELELMADGRPVFFENSYRDPSKYSFYTNKKPYVFTNEDYRKNQFDLWDWEKEIHNKSVFVMANPDWSCQACTKIKLTNRTINRIDAERLQVFSKLEVVWNSDGLDIRAGELIELNLKIFNPYEFDVQLRYGNLPVEMQMVLFETVESFELIPLSLPETDQMITPGINTVKARGVIPRSMDKQKKYEAAVGFNYQGFPPSIHSNRIKITIDQ